MISYHHFLFAQTLAIIVGAISIICALRLLLVYKREKESISLFMGICILGIGWIMLSFFARSLLPVQHALTCTFIGLIGLWFMFPFGALFPLKFLSQEHWKALGTIPFLISLVSLGLFAREIVIKGGLIQELLAIGFVPFSQLPSFAVSQALIVVIILLISGLFVYLLKISSGTLRRKSLILAIGFLLLLFLLPDIVCYGGDFLGIWRLGELCSCTVLYYGFSLKPG